MPLGRTREEQELTQLLSKTLVAKEVIEPMEKLGWAHGTPPPPDYSGPPAATEGAPGKEAAPAAAAEGGQPAPKPESTPAPTDSPKADSPVDVVALFESLRDPKNGKIMGKYDNVEQALKGAGHLANMAKQAFTERDEAVARLSTLSTDPTRTPTAAAPAAAPQPATVAAPSREAVNKAKAEYDAVLSKITENGGVLDAESQRELSAAQLALSEAIADSRYEEKQSAQKAQADANQSEWDKVDAYMAEKYPQSARFAEETALFMQSDPLLNAAVGALLAQGKRLEATELAWKSFEKAHGEQIGTEERAKAEEKEADLAAREQVRQEQLEKARKDAGIVQGSAGGAGIHQNQAAATSREEIAAATEAMRREGEAPGSPAAVRFRQMVIGPSLDPTFFPR